MNQNNSCSSQDNKENLTSSMRDKRPQLQLDKGLQETHHDFQAQELGLKYCWSKMTIKNLPFTVQI
jgi:hypothetical protein